MSTKDLKTKLDKKRITLLETLALERYREAHFPGALNLPPEKLPGEYAHVTWLRGLRKLAHYPEENQGWMEASLPVEEAA